MCCLVAIRPCPRRLLRAPTIGDFNARTNVYQHALQIALWKTQAAIARISENRFAVQKVILKKKHSSFFFGDSEPELMNKVKPIVKKMRPLTTRCHVMDTTKSDGGRPNVCPTSRDGKFWVEVIVKSCVNKQDGSWLAAQEWTTNQKPGQQVDPALDIATTHKFPPLRSSRSPSSPPSSTRRKRRRTLRSSTAPTRRPCWPRELSLAWHTRWEKFWQILRGKDHMKKLLP